MIRPGFVSLLVTCATKTSSQFDGVSNERDDLRVYVLKAETLEDLADSLVREGRRSFIPLDLPVREYDDAMDRFVWTIEGIYMTLYEMRAIVTELETPTGAFEKRLVTGDEPVAFFRDLGRATQNGFVPLVVMRGRPDNDDEWYTLAARPAWLGAALDNRLSETTNSPSVA